MIPAGHGATRRRTGRLLGAAFCAVAITGWTARALAFEARVVLPGDHPAAGATVSIGGRHGTARTDAAGVFSWDGEPAFPFDLVVVLHDGRRFGPVRVEAPAAGAPIVVAIPAALVEEIVVSGGAGPRLAVPPAAAVARIADADMTARHAQRLTDVIENVPGAAALEGGHSAVPSLRGQARGRTLLLVDGARVSAERRAGPSATWLDPFFLDEVEVVRGPGSVAYGSDAFGGVIAARTRRVEFDAPLRVRVRAIQGAGVPESSAGVEITRGLGDAGFVFQVRARDIEDYDAPGRVEVPDSAARDRGVLLRLHRKAGRGVLAVGIEADAGRDILKPSTDYPGTRAWYPEEESRRLVASYDLVPEGAWARASIDAFFGTYDLTTVRETAATVADPRRLAESVVAASDFALRAVGERMVPGNGRLEVGIDINGRLGLRADQTIADLDPAGALLASSAEASIEDARRLDAGLYASAEYPLGPRLTAAAGARFDEVGTRSTGGTYGDRSTRQAAVSGFAALTARPWSGFSATVQAARGFRDPTLSDRYFVGTSGRGTAVGNPDLDPETSTQYDVALRYGRERASVAVYAYDYRIDDLIERYESAPDVFGFRNRGQGRVRGLEADVRVESGGGFAATVGLQTSRGSADDGAPLADVPPLGGIIQVEQSWKRGLHVLARVASYLRDERPGPAEGVVPGWTTVDLGGGLALRPGLGLRLMVRNVLDRAYPAGPDSKSVLAPGRAGYLTLTAEF